MCKSLKLRKNTGKELSLRGEEELVYLAKRLAAGGGVMSKSMK
jgi:hypothetical protein